MRFNKDRTAITVNRSLTLAGIPAGVFDYRLGNRSALDWIVDQYYLSENPKSHIRSDPNRKNDPEYIVRLIGQIMQLSLKTNDIVSKLPDVGIEEGDSD